MELKPRIVLSRCFLEPVRYNGEIIKDEFVERLKPYIDYIDLCPEMDIGLGVPRQRVILVEENEEIRLIQPESGKDFTEKVRKYGYSVIKRINGIDGFLLKSKSPSCGVASAKLYKKGVIIGKTNGIFAEMIKQFFQYLPFEDEGRLRDREIREHFLIRLFAFSEMRGLINRKSAKELVEFHTKYKYLLMTYNQKILKELGRIVANHKTKIVDKIFQYKTLFYQAFDRKPSKKRNINTLLHIMGHFSKFMSTREKKHLLSLIDQFGKGMLDLNVILEVLKNLSYRFDNEYILLQKYLTPYPVELREVIRKFN
jgi:uncharacterized protein YbgA (DUF1722 family)/uncharacterized protein YbbK (DUF523 family)